MENPILDERQKRILNLINPAKSDNILVIGTGFYPKIEYFLFHNKECKKIVSGDISKENILSAKKLLPKLNFIYLDAQKRFPFKDKTFDKVILTEVLEHLPNEKFALDEIKRVLKINGSLIITVPRKRWFNIFSPVSMLSHKREYTEKSLMKVLSKSGFRTKKLFNGGSFFDWINLWFHLISKWIFKDIHINTESFLRNIINKTYKPNFKGKGTDIFAEAKI